MPSVLRSDIAGGTTAVTLRQLTAKTGQRVAMAANSIRYDDRTGVKAFRTPEEQMRRSPSALAWLMFFENSTLQMTSPDLLTMSSRLPYQK